MDDFVRFLTVADARSVSRAAEILGISQPALSRTIAMLETRFQSRLFERTATGMELTAPGTKLYQHAMRAMRAITDAEEELVVNPEKGSKSLSIAAGDGWGYGILPRLVRAFARAHPETSIRLDIANYRERMTGLKNGTYELVFGAVDQDVRFDPALTFLPLVESKYNIYCFEDHPLLESDIRTYKSLDRYFWINHRFEYDLEPAAMLRSARRYALRTNTMLSTIETMKQSIYLISTSNLLQDIFGNNGIVLLMEDSESPTFISGPMYMTGSRLRSGAKEMLRMAIELFKE